MNERIRELASCNERIQTFFETGPVQRAAIEQFAELIVQECVGLCQESIDDGCVEAEEPMRKIEKHFGVES
jgi:hypothetical protein